MKKKSTTKRAKKPPYSLVFCPPFNDKRQVRTIALSQDEYRELVRALGNTILVNIVGMDHSIVVSL